MSVTLLCPKLSCRTLLLVPDEVRGQRVRCSKCGTAFSVPAETGPPRPRTAGPPPTTAAKKNPPGG